MIKAEWPLLNKNVGPNGHNWKSDVKTFQQLLSAAGYDTGGDSGIWNDATTRALIGFRGDHFPGPLPPYPSEVAPDGDELMALVKLAQIEIPLPRQTGMNGIQRMHDWFVSQRIEYDPDAVPPGIATRAIYGIGGHPESAIQLIDLAWRHGPVQMDCTTYVNLMLGIFFTGGAHSAPYEAACGDFGGTSKIHCGRDRYGFKAIEAKFGEETRDYVTTADEMAAVAKEGKLYVLEVTTSKSSLFHMALLYNGNVMECRPKLACTSGSMADFIRAMGGRIHMYEQPA